MYELEDICSEEQKEEFRISDDKTADWALKIIQKERQEVERLCKTIDEEIKMLKLKKQKIADGLDNKIGFLQGKLFEYFRTVESKELNDSYMKLNKKKTAQFNTFQITSVISETIIDTKK